MSWGLRKTLLAGAAIAAMGMGPALADDEDVEDRETITVTGTRIQASGFNTPTPVTTVTAEELELASPGSMVTALVQLPQFVNSSTPSDPAAFFVSPGSGNLNLRGLATDRTLVLLDGRRVVSSTRYGGTDINTFPEGMIRTVEAVTGGASAAYGTDAVSGVVNFILDTDFEGVATRAQYGVTDRGDNENFEVGFSLGSELFGGRSHVLLAGEKADSDGVFGTDDRDWYQDWGIISGNTANGEPARLVRPNVTSTVATLDGVISAPGFAFHRYEFLPDGSYRPFVLGLQGATAGAFTSHTAGPGSSGTRNNSGGLVTIQPETSRESYFGYIDFDATPDFTIYAQGIWGRNDNTTTNIGGFFEGFFSPITIYQNNAFLPDEINDAMVAANRASFSLGRVGSREDLARNAWTITKNTMRSVTTGFDWDFLDGGLGGGEWLNGLHADAYFQSGQTSYNAIQRGGVRLDRLQMALDAVDDGSGNIVCRVNTEPFRTNNGGRFSDCVPLNLFGRGQASDAAVDWVTGFDPGQEVDTILEYTDTGTALGIRDHYISGEDKVSSGEIDQDVFEFNLSGELWKGWGAGPISGALGYHYREEAINQVVRIPVNPPNSAAARPVLPNDAQIPSRGAPWGIRGNQGGYTEDAMGNKLTESGNIGNSVAIQFSKVPNIRGKLSTIEYYGELLVPVIADQPFMELLTVNLAARRADFSGSGEIWAWKYGADAQITDEIRVRATQSRDIRAANLSERFDRTGGFANLVCFEPTAPSTILACPIFTVSGGDPEVDPEVADTITAGVVYQPNWLDGFSISVDWFDIELQDAIATLTAQQIYDECMAGDQALCSRIQFASAGIPSLVNQSVLNLNKAKVTGWDVEVGYRRPIELLGGGESIGVRFFAGYQQENSRTSFEGVTTDIVGGVGFPELRLNGSVNYTRGPLSLFLQERYTSETNLNNAWVEGVDIDDNSIDAVWYTDFNASYGFDVNGGEVQLFGNIANLFDQDPPVVAGYGNFGAAATQIGGQFDRLGRAYTVGVRYRH